MPGLVRSERHDMVIPAVEAFGAAAGANDRRYRSAL